MIAFVVMSLTPEHMGNATSSTRSFPRQRLLATAASSGSSLCPVNAPSQDDSKSACPMKAPAKKYKHPDQVQT